MTKLKLCPFCGGDPHLIVYKTSKGKKGKETVVIMCKNNKCIKCILNAVFGKKSATIRKWNKRRSANE